MSKVTLNSVGNLLDTTTSKNTINNNSTTIATAFDNTLSRDGTSPNQMSSTLDMNSNQILNLPAPLAANSPLRLQELSTFIGGGSIGSASSVGLSLPADFTVTNSPVTTTGTLTGAWATPPTGTGAVVRATSPTLVTPVLGTPTSVTLTNATGLPVGSVTGLAAGVGTFLATPTSANLKTALTDETGSGAAVFATSPTLVTPVLGTPSSGTLTSCTGLPLAGLNTQAAYTFVGNNTGSTAVPTAVDIATLTSKASPALTDLILISDQAASGAWKKATVNAVSAASGPVSSIAGNTGAFTLSNGITNSTNDIRLNIGQLPGETTTGNASAGNIGEYITVDVVSGSAVSLTTGTPANIGSMSLTAGDWEVTLAAQFKGGATTTITYTVASISTISATHGTADNAQVQGFWNNMVPFGTITQFSQVVPPIRISLASTTTIYMVASAGFGTSTLSVFGQMKARRAR